MSSNDKPLSRHSRAKRNLAWERIELESHGLYAENLRGWLLAFRSSLPQNCGSAP